MIDELIQAASEQLRAVLRERPRSQDLRGVSWRARDRRGGEIEFELQFIGGPPWHWGYLVPRPELMWLLRELDAIPFERMCLDIWRRVRREPIRAEEQRLRVQFARDAGHAGSLQEVNLLHERFERDLQALEARIFGVDDGSREYTAVSIDEGRQVSLRRETFLRMAELAAHPPAYFVEPLELNDPFGRWDGDRSGDRQRAEARGIALLEQWLSTEQLASWRKGKSFEVTGSASGKRYRIRNGTQMNIDELAAGGAKVCTWCFLPQGELAAGDVMLAQKIALETDEFGALKVANRFERDGRMRYSVQEVLDRWVPPSMRAGLVRSADRVIAPDPTTS